ncbi:MULTISPECIES: single-stranded DNA-binding protein [Comamonadaceae]|nr:MULTISPECIES: single-stranded DNA-binding protein [Comamonadaceae]WQD45935.1 single-stranded DNA-binding protein [Comamonas testosteroni]
MYKNQVILEGFLGKSPEIRFMPSGDKVANVTLATKEVWKDKAGKPVSSTEWHALVFYAERADRAELYEKGDNIHVEGKIQTRKYTDNAGHPKTVREIIVMRSHRIDRMHDEQDHGDHQTPPEQQDDAPASGSSAGDGDNWPKV